LAQGVAQAVLGHRLSSNHLSLCVTMPTTLQLKFSIIIMAAMMVSVAANAMTYIKDEILSAAGGSVSHEEFYAQDYCVKRRDGTYGMSKCNTTHWVYLEYSQSDTNCSQASRINGVRALTGYDGQNHYRATCGLQGTMVELKAYEQAGCSTGPWHTISHAPVGVCRKTHGGYIKSTCSNGVLHSTEYQSSTCTGRASRIVYRNYDGDLFYYKHEGVSATSCLGLVGSDGDLFYYKLVGTCTATRPGTTSSGHPIVAPPFSLLVALASMSQIFI